MPTGDPAALVALAILAATAVVAVAGVHLPLATRLVRVSALSRRVKGAFAGEERSAGARRYDVDAAFRHSPLAPQWEEFLRRWFEARTPGDDEGRSPVRLRDVLEESPVLPAGPRRALLPALPGLLVAAGALGTFAGLARLAPELGGPADAEALAGLAPRLALPLWSALGGLGLGIAAAGVARWMEGSAAAGAGTLDRLVARAYAPISAGELTTRAAGAQREATDLLRSDLARVLDVGLERIESSTAAAASLVSEEQRGGLRKVVEVLADEVRRGVNEQMGALRAALERTARHQEEVAGGLAQAFDRMTHAVDTHRRLTEALEQAAGRIEAASRGLAATVDGFEPVAGELRVAGSAFERTTTGMATVGESAATTLAELRASLDAQARAAGEQRELLEASLGTLRDGMGQLSKRLADDVARGLSAVDRTVAGAAARFGESVERGEATLERLTTPLAATEALASELGRTLERVAAEVGGLGTRMGRAMQPIRSTLVSIEDRSGAIARTLADFRERAQDAQRTMEAMRGTLGDEARELRTAASELGRQMRAAREAGTERPSPAAAGSPTGAAASAAAAARPPASTRTDRAAAQTAGSGGAPPEAPRPAPVPVRPAVRLAARERPPAAETRAAADAERTAENAETKAEPRRPRPAAASEDGSQGLSELLRARRPDEPAALRGAEGERRRLLEAREEPGGGPEES